MHIYQKIIERGLWKPETTAVSFIRNDLSVEKYNYQQMFEIADNFVAKLNGYGVLKKQKVAIIAPNSPYWVFSHLALAKAEMVSVLIDVNLPKKEMLELLNKVDIDLILTEETTYNHKLKDNIEVLCLNIYDNLSKLNSYTLDNKIDPELKETDVMLFSSGTTSLPTGIKHKADSLVGTTISCLNENGINNDGERYLALLPLNHIYGLLTLLYAPLITGSEVRYFETINGDGLSFAFKDFRPTFMAVVPKICELLRGKIEQEIKAQGKDKIFNLFMPICFKIRSKTGWNIGRKLFDKVHEGLGGCIKTMCVGGAATKVDTAKFLIGTGFNFLVTYGGTETNIPVTGSRGKWLSADTIGFPYPGVEVKLSSNNEILVKSPYAMLGYYKNEEETNKLFKDGFFSTGDTGYFNKDGRLIINGRIKENIVLSTGKKVFPETIEKEFSGLLDFVSEYAVVGKPLKDFGYDETHIFIVKKEDNENVIRDKVKEINATLPPHMRINKVHFIADIPKTALDKIRRFELIKNIKDEDENKGNLTFEEQIICDCLRIANLDIDYKTVSKSAKIFEDLGIDSLSTIELLLSVEKKYGITFNNFNGLDKEITVQEFVDLIKSKMN